MRSIVLLLASFLILNLSAQTFNTGTDLSYLNEMEDCGAIYSEDGEARDPYKIFMDHNTQIVRYRLWHTPGWTDYSTLADVSKSFMRAKEAGFQILLTFHYSDTWADAGQQLRPAAWSGIENTAVLADSMYNYTYKTLLYFQNNGMLPDLVQIGNETNGNILLNEGDPLFPLEWSRNITLFDEGIKAVNQINQNFGTDIKTVIHIAQPENARWWFDEAYNNGFTGFDIIGLSYYPGWSEMTCRGAAEAVGELRQTYSKEVMVVETGYPWTLAWADDAANSLGIGNLLPCYGFNPSPENQRDFLTEFTWLVKENGGMGVIYWEPAWVSTDCYTQWGQGSHWENATFFDFDYNLHVGIGFMDWDYTIMPPALDSIGTVFKVDMTGIDTTQGVFVTGNFTGEDWQFIKMNHIGENIFEINTKIPGRSSGAYIFQNKADWGVGYREPVPEECALYWESHREYVVTNEITEFAYIWGTCIKIGELSVEEIEKLQVHVFPNPFNANIRIESPITISGIEISDISGKLVWQMRNFNASGTSLDISGLINGVYLLKIISPTNQFTYHKIVKK